SPASRSARHPPRARATCDMQYVRTASSRIAAMSRCSPSSSPRRGPAKNCSGTMTSGSRSVLSCSSSFIVASPIVAPPPRNRARGREQVPCQLGNSPMSAASTPPTEKKGGLDCSFYTSRVERHPASFPRSEEHTSELQSLAYLVCRLLLE